MKQTQKLEAVFTKYVVWSFFIYKAIPQSSPKSFGLE